MDDGCTDQFERLGGVGGSISVQEGGGGREDHVDTSSPGGKGVFVWRVVPSIKTNKLKII